MGKQSVKTEKMTVSLSKKARLALKYFSERLGLSQSAIISLALSHYFMDTPEYRLDSRFAEIVGQSEIDLYEKSHGIGK